MNFPKLLFKATALLGMAALSMGNEGCEQQAAEGPRTTLKRIVEIGKISARPVYLPNGQEFDMEFVINNQFREVLVASTEFSLLKRLTSTPDTLTPEGVRSKVAVMDSDMKVMNGISSKADQWYRTKEAECFVNMPQWYLGGNVNSYELVTSAGLRLGYGVNGAHNPAQIGVDANIHFDNYELDMSMNAYNPIDKEMVKHVKITKSQLESKINFGINFGLISIGPEFYHRESLASVTREALEKALVAIKKKTEEIEWYSNIGFYEEGFAVIKGGENVGIQAGDEFGIYSSEYYWTSRQDYCNPEAYVDRLDSNQPIAIGVVDSIGQRTTRLKIDDRSIVGNVDPRAGFIVKIHKLAGTPKK